MNVCGTQGEVKSRLLFLFGIIGFSKPAVLAPWKGQRLVLCVYLGMRYVTGGGVLVFPMNPDSLGNREVIRGHSFRIRKGVQFDVQTVWPLLAGVIPNDPSVAPPFRSQGIVRESSSRRGFRR